MSSTTKRMWRMPAAVAGAGPSSPSYEGERYLASSTLPLPSGVRRIAISARTPSSPFMRSTEPPSTDASPSNSSPSAAKNAVAAARSSTTMPMCSRRWTVMNGLRPAPAACTPRAADPSASWSPGVVVRAARGPSPDERSRSALLDIGTLIQLPGSSRRGNRLCGRLPSMDLELTDKVAVVTGASKGIGLAVVRELAAEGAIVVAGARSVEALEGIDRVTPLAVDLAEADGPARLIAQAIAFHGRVDVLVNNVGAVHPRLNGFLNVSDEDFEASLQLNFFAAAARH